MLDMQDKETRLYLERTVEHIHRVHNRGVQLAKYKIFPKNVQKFMYQLMKHDRSKFSVNQYEAYKRFSFCMKKCIKLTEEEQSAFDLAWQDHYNAENHHPEKENVVYLTGLEPFETACDLQAMADEFGEGSARKYFENVWKPKMKKHFLYDDREDPPGNYIPYEKYCEMISEAITIFENIGFDDEE